MSLATRVTDLTNRVAAEIKSLRTADANAKLDRPGGFQSPGVRRAAFYFGSGNNTKITNYDNGFFRVPIRLPVTTTRWRVRMSNKDNSGVSTGAGTWTIPSVWIGDTFRNLDTGDPISWTGVNTQCLTTSGAKAPADEWVSPWVTAPAAQITPHTMRTLSVEFTKTAGSTIYMGSGGCWISDVRAEVSTGVPGTNMPYAAVVPFAFAIEYEFVGTNKIIAVVGDSISEGVGSTFNINTWHQRASMRLGMPFVVSASSGAFAQTGFTNSYGDTNAATLAQPRWQRIRDGALNIDAAIVHLGTNETAWGGTLLGWQQGMVLVYNRIRSEWNVRDVFATTLAPRNLTGAPETLRQSMNSYIRSGKSFYIDTFDFANELEASPAGAALRGDYGGPNNDATHWGDVGQHRASLAIHL